MLLNSIRYFQASVATGEIELRSEVNHAGVSRIFRPSAAWQDLWLFFA